MEMANPREPKDEDLDRMLLLLKDTPFAEPPAQIRQNLQWVIAASRQRNTLAPRLVARSNWLRWVLSSAACVTILVAIGLLYAPRLSKKSAPLEVAIAHVSRPETDRGHGRGFQSSAASPLRKVNSRHFKSHSFLPPRRASQPHGFDVELPYSNRDIANGTNATIRVEVSREELVALGFPLDELSGKDRYLAEIALGDDGLPRSIHIPLPLRSIN